MKCCKSNKVSTDKVCNKLPKPECELACPGITETGDFAPTWRFCLIPHLVLMRNSAAAAKSLQLCPTLCDPIDGSPRGFPVPGILQARTLEWVAISFSKKEKANTFSGADIEEGATSIVRRAQSPTKTFPVCLEGEVSNSVAPTAQIKIHCDWLREK